MTTKKSRKRSVIPKSLAKDEDLVQRVRMARHKAAKTWSRDGSHSKRSWQDAAQRKEELAFMRQHRREKRRQARTSSVDDLHVMPDRRPAKIDPAVTVMPEIGAVDAAMDIDVVLGKFKTGVACLLKRLVILGDSWDEAAKAVGCTVRQAKYTVRLVIGNPLDLAK